MALLDEAKLALRLSSGAYDGEVESLLSAAIADMRRVGVREELLEEDSMDPIAKMACIAYAKAGFGFDNADAARFEASYRQLVCDLMNSGASESLSDGGGE